MVEWVVGLQNSWPVLSGLVILGVGVGRTWQISGDTRERVRRMNGDVADMKREMVRIDTIQQLCPLAQGKLEKPERN
jgi:hypothetical protein